MKMNKNPRKVTMLDVLDTLRDRDGRDLFNSIATDRRSNDTFDYTVKITRNSITLDSLN